MLWLRVNSPMLECMGQDPIFTTYLPAMELQASDLTSLSLSVLVTDTVPMGLSADTSHTHLFVSFA